jgi:replicative DNA helicase
MGVIRRASIWALQITLAALMFFLIWHPALSVSALKPQQNIVAVVIDDSSSMTTGDENSTRKEAVEKILNGGLLKALQEKFQVRLYRMSDHAERIENRTAHGGRNRHAHRRELETGGRGCVESSHRRR